LSSSPDFPERAGYTGDRFPPISRQDEEGFSSCAMCPCHRTVAPNPAGVARRISQRVARHVAFAKLSIAQPPVLSSFEANSRSLSLRPGNSLAILMMGLSMGFRVLVSRHPAIQATGRLALAPAGLTPAEHTCLSLDTRKFLKTSRARPRQASARRTLTRRTKITKRFPDGRRRE